MKTPTWSRGLAALASLVGPWPMSAALAAEEPTAYICTLDKTIGFRFENGSWGQVTFKTESFILKQRRDPKDANKVTWALTEHGKTALAGVCFDTVPVIGDSMSEISCEGIYKLQLDKKTLRFLYSYFAGYTNGLDTNADTPALGIGKCSPI